MRIALFTDAIPPRLDGVALTMARLARELGERGHQVAVVAPGPFESPRGVSLSVPLPAFAVPGLSGGRCIFGGGGELDAILDRFAPEVVHATTELPVGIVGRRYATRRGLPLVTCSHTDLPAYVRHWGFSALEGATQAWLCAFHAASDVVLCPSRTHAASLRRWGVRGRIRLWGRGVDTVRFDPARRSDAFRRQLADDGEIIVLGVGRLMPEKRFDRLLDAIAELPSGVARRLRPVLVGEGFAERSLRARAPSSTRFLGSLRGDELARIYAAADLFVLPSDEETFGNVVLEAMASGLPALVSTLGAAHELVGPGAGEALDLSVPGRLAAALERWSASSSLRREAGRRARELALEHRWERATEQALAGYAEALDVARGRDLGFDPLAERPARPRLGLEHAADLRVA